jgi:hypothetical protein
MAGALADIIGALEVQPDHRFGRDGTITIGSVNAAKIAERLDGLVLPVHSAQVADAVAVIRVHTVTSTNQLKACDLVLFGKQPRTRIQSLIQASARVGVLSCGIYPEFIADGGCLNLGDPENRLPAHFNRTALRALGLRLRLRLRADEKIVALDFTPVDPTDVWAVKNRVFMDVVARRKDAATQKSQTEIAAAMALKLLEYVIWPEEVEFTQSRPLRFGFRGSDARFSILKKFADRNSSRLGYRTEWLRNPTAEEATNCDVLYITADHRGTAPHLLEEIRKKPVLTIGNGKAFLEQGGLLSIAPEGKKLRIRHNPTVLKESAIQLREALVKLMSNTNRIMISSRMISTNRPTSNPSAAAGSKRPLTDEDEERYRRLRELMKKRREQQNSSSQ